MGQSRARNFQWREGGFRVPPAGAGTGAQVGIGSSEKVRNDNAGWVSLHSWHKHRTGWICGEVSRIRVRSGSGRARTHGGESMIRLIVTFSDSGPMLGGSTFAEEWS